jgi:hypothetical protein
MDVFLSGEMDVNFNRFSPILRLSSETVCQCELIIISFREFTGEPVAIQAGYGDHLVGG